MLARKPSRRPTVTVLLDDADKFAPGLIGLMIDSLASRLDGQVLVVAAVRLGTNLKRVRTMQSLRARSADRESADLDIHEGLIN